MNKPCPLKSVIGDRRNNVHRLVAHALQLQRLDHLLKQQLPPSLAAHCHVANVRDAVLILQADSPAWASRLRYGAPQLLRTMQRLPGLESLTGIRVTVSPPEQATKVARRSAAPGLSAENAALLRQTAETLDEASPLRRALERLASRSIS